MLHKVIMEVQQNKAFLIATWLLSEADFLSHNDLDVELFHGTAFKDNVKAPLTFLCYKDNIRPFMQRF